MGRFVERRDEYSKGSLELLLSIWSDVINEFQGSGFKCEAIAFGEISSYFSNSIGI